MVGMAVHQPHPFLQLVHGFNILRNSLRFANSSRLTAIWSPPFGFPVHRSLQVFRQSTNFISPVETGKALLEKVLLVRDAGGPAAAGNATTPGNTVPEEAERRFPSFRLLPLPALVPSCVALCSRIKSQHFAPRVRPRPRCVHFK